MLYKDAYMKVKKFQIWYIDFSILWEIPCGEISLIKTSHIIPTQVVTINKTIAAQISCEYLNMHVCQGAFLE